MELPSEPTGNSLHASWLRALRRFVLGERLLPGVGYRKKQTNKGYTLELLPISKGKAFYPFKLYLHSLPDTDADARWRTFRVRAGRVILDDVHEIDVDNTDGMNSDPDSGEIPDVEDPGELFTVPDETDEFWFWIELDRDAVTAQILASDDPTSAGWDSFPSIDGDHIPVAMVDTSTKSDQKVAVVRQLLRADVLNPKDDCPLG